MNIRTIQITGSEYIMLQTYQALVLALSITGALALHRHHPHLTFQVVVEYGGIVAITYVGWVFSVIVAGRMSHRNPHMITGIAKHH